MRRDHLQKDFVPKIVLEYEVHVHVLQQNQTNANAVQINKNKVASCDIM